MALSAVIVDDEQLARDELAYLLRELDVDIVAQGKNGVEAVNLVKEFSPDLVFLDVQMPELDGVAVAEALAARGPAPRIVFVTAFDKHAVRAFELNALDYLLKPYDRERFAAALERARASLLAPAPRLAELAELLERLREGERYPKRLLIPHENSSFYLPVRDIVRLAADGNAVAIHTKRGTYSVRATLESFEDRLDPQLFARVHRSHVVNIDEIAEVHPWFHGDQKLVLRDGVEVAWSRRYAAKRPDLLR